MKRSLMFLLLLPLLLACNSPKEQEIVNSLVTASLSSEVDGYPIQTYFYENDVLFDKSKDRDYTILAGSEDVYQICAVASRSFTNLKMPEDPLTGIVELKNLSDSLPDLFCGTSERTSVRENSALKVPMKRVVSAIHFTVLSDAGVKSIEVIVDGLCKSVNFDGSVTKPESFGSRTFSLLKQGDTFEGGAVVFPKDSDTLTVTYNYILENGSKRTKKILLNSNGSPILAADKLTEVTRNDRFDIEAELSSIKWVNTNNTDDSQTANPLDNEVCTVFPMDALFKPVTGLKMTPSGNVLRVAKGEHAIFEVLITAKEAISGVTAEYVQPVNESKNVLSDASMYWMRSVYCNQDNIWPADRSYDILVAKDGKFPDLLIPVAEGPESVNAGGRIPLVVDINIPEDTKPGIYSGKVKLVVTGASGSKNLEVPFTVRVYPVSVGEPKLFVTNWIFTWFLKQLNNGQELDKNLEWELLGKLLDTCVSLGQNTGMIDGLHMYVGRTDVDNDGKLEFHFERIDELIEFYLAHGMKRIEAGHICQRITGDFSSDFGYEKMDYTNPKVEEFFSQYFPALRQHLIDKGWKDIFIQHIADEPDEANADSYVGMGKLIKKYFPDIVIMDAMNGTAYEKIGTVCDILVPKPDALDSYRSYYEARAKEKETWIYTCMVPQKQYANRFLQLPLIKTRILHWINYKSGTKGFLHWGLLYWPDDFYKDIYQDTALNGAVGGDSFIIYPGYRQFYYSIRALTMRDGIYDYNLLKLVEEKSPVQAKAFVDEMVLLNYASYNTDVDHFRDLRRRMLEYLSE